MRLDFENKRSRRRGPAGSREVREGPCSKPSGPQRLQAPQRCTSGLAGALPRAGMRGQRCTAGACGASTAISRSGGAARHNSGHVPSQRSSQGEPQSRRRHNNNRRSHRWSSRPPRRTTARLLQPWARAGTRGRAQRPRPRDWAGAAQLHGAAVRNQLGERALRQQVLRSCIGRAYIGVSSPVHISKPRMRVLARPHEHGRMLL